MEQAAFPTASVLGVDVVVGTVESAADAVIERALSGQGGYAVLCNVHVLMTARKQVDVMTAVRQAWAILPDGAPIAWLQRREGRTQARRVGGPDLLLSVLDRGRESALRHVLYGSTPDVLRRLEQAIWHRFPGAEIVAAIAPEFGCEDDPSLIEKARDAQAHVIWIALGAPKQELWIARHRPRLDPALLLGVGAAFDFVSGTKARAPAWTRSAGLEWLHRLITEPRRLTGRYVTTNTLFLLNVVPTLWNRNRHPNDPT